MCLFQCTVYLIPALQNGSPLVQEAVKSCHDITTKKTKELRQLNNNQTPAQATGNKTNITAFCSKANHKKPSNKK